MASLSLSRSSVPARLRKLERVLRFTGRALLRQRSLLFRPSRRIIATPAELGLRYEDVQLAAIGRAKVTGWWLPGESEKVVLYLPSALGNMSHDLPALRYLRRLGAAVFVIDYPGFGASAGRAHERACYSSAELAWEHLIGQRRCRQEDIIVFGRSLGSALAAQLTAGTHCGGLVFQSGFSSIQEVARAHLPAWLVGLLCRIRLEPIVHLPRCRSAAMIVHCRRDRFVPIANARKVLEAIPTPARFIQVEGGHLSDAWLYDKALLKHWRELLAGKAAQWTEAPI